MPDYSTRCARLPSSAASTNAALARDFPYRLDQVSAYSARATPCYLKLYQMSAAQIVAGTVPDETMTPMLTLTLSPGNNAFDYPKGVGFRIGLGYRITANPADSDTTAIGAGDVTGLNLLGTEA